MKCPVCDNVNESMVCVRCGFDSSRDYEKYPTFGPVGKGPSVSGFRERRQVNPAPPDTAEPKRKVPVWLMAAACLLTMVLGIWIGTGVHKPDPTEPGESAQMQEAVETTTAPPETTQLVETADPEAWRNNVLQSDPVVDVDWDGTITNIDAYHNPVFGSAYQRSQIQSVTILDALTDMPRDAWDVSGAGNGTVMAWVKPNGQLYDLYIGAEGGVSAGESCKRLFAGYENAVSINLGDCFDTSNVQDMSQMFLCCESLTELTLGEHFDTSNVQDMSRMFYDCGSLTELTLGECFDTSNVRDMSEMFNYCNDLVRVTLGDRFDTSNVQNMSSMFGYCTSLKELNLGDRFDTYNVQDMSSMFDDCWALVKLNLGDCFDTSNVRGMHAMFANCTSLTELTLGKHFDTSNVQDMSWMFSFCSSLSKLTLGDRFDTSNVQDMHTMFWNCTSLKELTLGDHFDTSNVQDMGYMFSHCESLTDLTLGDKFVTTNADTTDMFEYCPAGEDYNHLLN